MTVCCVTQHKKLNCHNTLNSKLEFITKKLIQAQRITITLLHYAFGINPVIVTTRKEGADVKGLPESIEHRAVRVQTNHPVLHSDAVNEGLLVVEEVGVGDPQLIRHSVIQSQVVRNLRVGQTFVPPRLLEVHGQGVVLEDRGESPFNEASAALH